MLTFYHIWYFMFHVLFKFRRYGGRELLIDVSWKFSSKWLIYNGNIWSRHFSLEHTVYIATQKQLNVCFDVFRLKSLYFYYYYSLQLTILTSNRGCLKWRNYRCSVCYVEHRPGLSRNPATKPKTLFSDILMSIHFFVIRNTKQWVNK